MKTMMKKLLFIILALVLFAGMLAGCSKAGDSQGGNNAGNGQKVSGIKDAGVELASPSSQVDHQAGSLRLGEIPPEEEVVEYSYDDVNEWIEWEILAYEEHGGYSEATYLYYEITNLFEWEIEINVEAIYVNGEEMRCWWREHVEGGTTIQDRERVDFELSPGDIMVFHVQIEEDYIDNNGIWRMDELGRIELTFIVDEVSGPGDYLEVPEGWIDTVEEITFKIYSIDHEEASSWGPAEVEVNFIMFNPTDADVDFIVTDIYINGVRFEGEMLRTLFSVSADFILRDYITLYEVSFNSGDTLTIQLEMRKTYDRANITQESVELNFVI